MPGVMRLPCRKLSICHLIRRLISVGTILNAGRLLQSWGLAEQPRVLPAEMGCTQVPNLKCDALDIRLSTKEEPPGFQKPKPFQVLVRGQGGQEFELAMQCRRTHAYKICQVVNTHGIAVICMQVLHSIGCPSSLTSRNQALRKLPAACA